MAATRKTYKQILDQFNAPVSKVDCGYKCASYLDGASPVCCSASQAIPIAQKPEWKELKKRSDLWHKFKPTDAHGQAIIGDMHEGCIAIECKGVKHCERDNRSLACRAFPFFPYITREGEFIGLAFYWSFEDRCWMTQNLKLVEKSFVKEFKQAYDLLFRDDPDEFELYRQYSATMRRVFSRWKRPIPLIALDGKHKKILPHGGGIKAAK